MMYIIPTIWFVSFIQPLSVSMWCLPLSKHPNSAKGSRLDLIKPNSNLFSVLRKAFVDLYTQVESFVNFLLQGFREELEEIKVLECVNFIVKFYLDGIRFKRPRCKSFTAGQKQSAW